MSTLPKRDFLGRGNSRGTKKQQRRGSANNPKHYPNLELRTCLCPCQRTFLVTETSKKVTFENACRKRLHDCRYRALELAVAAVFEWSGWSARRAQEGAEYCVVKHLKRTKELMQEAFGYDYNSRVWNSEIAWRIA